MLHLPPVLGAMCINWAILWGVPRPPPPLWQVLLQVSNFDTNQALTSVAALRLRERIARDPMLIEKEAADAGASPAW